MEHYLALESFSVSHGIRNKNWSECVILIPSCCNTINNTNKRSFCVHRDFHLYHDISASTKYSISSIQIALWRSTPQWYTRLLRLWICIFFMVRQQKEYSPSQSALVNLRCRCAHARVAVRCLWFRTNPLLGRLSHITYVMQGGRFAVILDGRGHHLFVCRWGSCFPPISQMI